MMEALVVPSLGASMLRSCHRRQIDAILSGPLWRNVFELMIRLMPTRCDLRSIEESDQAKATVRLGPSISLPTTPQGGHELSLTTGNAGARVCGGVVGIAASK